MSWTIEFSRPARQQLRSLDRPIQVRIVKALDRLAYDPLSAPNVIAMTGGGLRLRVGDWRVVYELHADRLVVFVIRIGHRSEVYR